MIFLRQIWFLIQLQCDIKSEIAWTSKKKDILCENVIRFDLHFTAFLVQKLLLNSPCRLKFYFYGKKKTFHFKVFWGGLISWYFQHCFIWFSRRYFPCCISRNSCCMFLFIHLVVLAHCVFFHSLRWHLKSQNSLLPRHASLFLSVVILTCSALSMWSSSDYVCTGLTTFVILVLMYFDVEQSLIQIPNFITSVFLLSSF